MRTVKGQADPPALPRRLLLPPETALNEAPLCSGADQPTVLEVDEEPLRLSTQWVAHRPAKL